MRFTFLPAFLKQLKKLEKDLQQEVFEKIKIFKEDQNHSYLKVYKLKGPLKGNFSFSVNYKTRVIFERKSDNVLFLAVGDHDIYK